MENESRAIKFRAWDKERKQMFSGNEIIGPKPHLHGTLMGLPDAPMMWTLNDYFSEIQKVYEVMQFTGLHDKNKKPIFEGDIVSFPDTESEHVDVGVGMLKVAETPMVGWGAVTMENYSWGIMVEGSPETLNKGFNSFDYILNDYGFETKELEVIGNVHENPEFIQSLKK